MEIIVLLGFSLVAVLAYIDYLNDVDYRKHNGKCKHNWLIVSENENVDEDGNKTKTVLLKCIHCGELKKETLE